MHVSVESYENGKKIEKPRIYSEALFLLMDNLYLDLGSLLE